jgi:hypothetical protein
VGSESAISWWMGQRKLHATLAGTSTGRAIILDPEDWRVGHALGWFHRLCPKSFFRTLLCELEMRERSRVFTLPVTVWLMMMQRLSGTGGTLAAVVSELVNGNGWDALEPCKRVREQRISTAPEVSVRRARACLWRLPDECRSKPSINCTGSCGEEANSATGCFCWMAVRLSWPHKRDLQSVRTGKESVRRISLACHASGCDASCRHGLALPPEYGAMYGPNAVGEQKLGEKLMAALPPSAVLIADRNFGIFSVMWQAAQLGHDVVIRLTKVRAEKIHRDLKTGSDRQVVWEPTRHDRLSNKDLPQAAKLQGRLLVVDGEIGAEPLYLFTALEDPAETVAGLYRERWLIETDLRSLKEQVKLHSISAKTPQMAATELLLAVAAYNLIRAVMGEAVGQIGIDPRRLSFSRSQATFWAFTRAVAQRCSAEKFEHHRKLLLRSLSQCKLPNRKRPPEPRKIWGKQSAFPLRKVRLLEEN